MAPGADTNSQDWGRRATATATAAAAAILATVYVAQYGFDLWPCELCLLQRVPYFLIVVLGALALMPAVDSRSRRIVLFHLAGLFLLDAGFALYHTGVEFHWWQGPDACTGGSASGISVNDLMGAMGKPGHPQCDEPAWLWHGISLAGFNIFAALALAGASVAAALRKAWWTQP